MRERIRSEKIIDAAIATETSEVRQPWYSKKTFQAIGTTTSGAGSATVLIEGSNDDDKTNWVLLATLSLSIADENTPDNEGAVVDASWKYMRADLTAIAGTGTAVTVIMGFE